MMHSFIRIVLFTIGFVFTCGISLAQDKTIVYFDKNWKPCKKENAAYYREIYYQSERKPTSIVRDYYLDGRLQWEGKLISENPDVLDSICTWYDGNGKVKEQRTYKSGQLNGPSLLYNQQGVVTDMKFYENDLLNGPSVKFSFNGKERVKENYKNGQLEGKRFTYYTNGSIESHSVFADNKLQGNVLQYDTTGKIVLENTPYEAGVIHGVYHRYFRTGNLAEARIYKYDKDIGPDTLWHENGMIARISTYEYPGDNYRHLIYDIYGHFTEEETNATPVLPIPFLHIEKDRDKCLYGLKNIHDKWVVLPTYSTMMEAYPATEGFITTMNGKYGYISENAKLVVKPEYGHIAVLSNGRRNYKTAVSAEEKVFPSFLSFTDPVSRHYGLISRLSGKVVLPAQFDEIDMVWGTCCLFIVKKNGLYGVTDSSKVLIDPQYYYLTYLSENFEFDVPDTVKGFWGDSAVIRSGVISMNGDTIIQPAFDFFTPYSGLLWTVRWNKTGSKVYGLFTGYGKMLLEPGYEFANSEYPDFMAQGIDAIMNDSMFYLIDKEGKILNTKPYEYLEPLKIGQDFISQITEVAAIFRDSGLYGLLDRTGAKLIASKYGLLNVYMHIQADKRVSYFFIAKMNGRYGLINENDSVILPFDYEWIFDYDGLYAIRNGKMVQFDKAFLERDYNGTVLDRKLSVFKRDKDPYSYSSGVLLHPSQVILDPIYHISEFNNHKAVFSDKNGMQGEIWDDGKIVYTQKKAFKSINQFVQGYASVVSFNGKMGVVNEKEELLIDTLYDVIAGFDPESGTCWVKYYMDTLEYEPSEFDEFPAYGSWGLVNSQGQLLLDTVYDQQAFFNDGYAIVQNHGAYGLVKTDGTIVLPCKYQELQLQPNGKYLYKENNKWGMIDHDGMIIVPAAWTDVTGFYGSASLYLKDKQPAGIMDADGNQIDDAESTYNRSGKFLTDSFPFFAEVAEENYSLKATTYTYVDGWKLTDNMFDTTKKRMMCNRIAIMASENIFIDSNTKIEPEYPISNYDEDKYGDQEFGTASEGINYLLDVISVNQRSFTVHKEEESYFAPAWGRGSSESTHEFITYGFAKDSVYRLALSKLFIGGYRPALIRAIVKGMKEIEDTDLDCSNPSQYLEDLDNMFSITAQGLIFYIDAGAVENQDEFVELLIPYTAIKSIINKKGVLAEFVK